MTGEKTDLLDDAVARNLGVVLSFPSAGMLRHHKSRFLGMGDGGIWAESPPGEAQLADALIGSGRPVGCSFRSGENKVIFTAPLLRRDPEFAVNAEVRVEAVLLQRPAEMKTVQRRAAYRVRVPQDYDLAVRLWRIGRDAYLKDRPMAACEIPCTLLDLSTGGVGLMLRGHAGNGVAIDPADRLRVELTHAGESFVIEGRLRYPQHRVRSDTVRAGVQFLDLQDDLEGRRVAAALTRLCGELQRLELRRYRLGLA